MPLERYSNVVTDVTILLQSAAHQENVSSRKGFFVNLQTKCNRYFHNTDIYEYKQLSGDILSDSWFFGPSHLWHESDERGFAKDGGIAVTTHLGGDDNQSSDRNAHRYLYHVCSAKFVGYHCYDGIFCQRRTAYLGSSHLCHHGCQYRYHAHGMDHVSRLQCRLNGRGVPSILPGHHADIQQAPSIYRRLSVWYRLLVFLARLAEQCGQSSRPRAQSLGHRVLQFFRYEEPPYHHHIPLDRYGHHLYRAKFGGSHGHNHYAMFYRRATYLSGHCLGDGREHRYYGHCQPCCPGGQCPGR